MTAILDDKVRIAQLTTALARIARLTPSAANAGSADDLHMTVKAIALTALDEASVSDHQAALQMAAPVMWNAIKAVIRCARGELERPATERTPWTEAEAAIGAAVAIVEASGGKVDEE